MAYKLQIHRYRPQNHVLVGRYALIFIVLILINGLGYALKLNLFMLVSLNAAIGLIAFSFLKLNSKDQVPFIRIQDSKLEYLCPHKNKIITVYANEITNITTRFFELRIHTASEVHTINLEQITEVKKRWEVKEMIRQLASLKTEMHLAQAN